MSIGFVFGLIAIASGFTSFPLVAGFSFKSWAINVAVFTPSSPPPIIDLENITFVHDGLGHLHKVDINKVKNEPIPYFSVENDVIFELFTHKNPTEPQILKINNYTSVKNSNFNWWYPTRVLIHGWYSEGVLTPKFADAYITRGNHKVNFIAVNWRKGSDVYNYYNARYRVNDVAAHVARFIDFMNEKAWMRINDLTIVGHSLGAHVSGIAGKKITRGKVGKIVGLDPASPFFKYEAVNDRLADTDASYVEVIHTCAGTLGFSQPLGTASFYPNGGRAQPGCGWDMSGACAHGRAYEFYLESIVKPQFYAFQCESLENLQKGNCSVVNHVVQMGGEPGVKNGKGIYYLQTNGESVYARGKLGIMKAVLAAKERTRSVKEIFSGLFNEEAVNETTPTTEMPTNKLILSDLIYNQIDNAKAVEETVDIGTNAPPNKSTKSMLTYLFNKQTVDETVDVTTEVPKNKSMKTMLSDLIYKSTVNEKAIEETADVTTEVPKNKSMRMILANWFKKPTVDESTVEETQDMSTEVSQVKPMKNLLTDW